MKKVFNVHKQYLLQIFQMKQIYMYFTFHSIETTSAEANGTILIFEFTNYLF